MYKKLFAAFLLLTFSLSVYADIQVVQLEGDSVEIIFTYEDDSAAAMNVIGSFDGWIVPGDPMEKNGQGLWEYRLTATVDDEIQYKFYDDGNWITDPMAPAEKDDGFGGANGLIIVADLLGMSEVAAAGTDGSDAEETVVPAFKSKLNFGMYTILGSRTTFSTQAVADKTIKGLETDSTGISGKSYWKIGGDITPRSNIWFELMVLDGYQPVWEQDATGTVTTATDTGLSGLFTGLFVNPVHFIEGGDPALNSIKAGIETPWIEIDSGYGYAKPRTRSSVLWETLNERDANDGYVRFDLGSEISKIGDVDIEATFAPNKMSGNLGLFSWIGADFGKFKFDFQYDAKSVATDSLENLFEKLYHQDLILGLNLDLSFIEISAQSMVNLYSETDFAFGDNFSGELFVEMENEKRSLGASAGYRYVGSGSEFLFGNNDDLGDKGTQVIYASLYGKPVDMLKLGFNTSATLVTDNLDNNDVELYGKIYSDLELTSLFGHTTWFNAYADMKYLLKKDYVYDASLSKYLFRYFGMKFFMDKPAEGIDGMDIYYGLNNRDEEHVFNTLISSFRMSNNFNAELGLGLRTPRSVLSQTEKDSTNYFGFSIGGSWQIPAPKIKSPVLYGAFVFNMDPYDDGTNNLKMEDYTTDGGSDKSDGSAQFRLMMKWDF
ncbi:MAG: glycogen-binding domain-containing protein [Spirochaetales bacterium]|nr:glycogen-binding domain-containing protein [Spirochaetales bacterium]